jgi:transcriptional regulator with XRE-family HTH domain
VAEDVAEAEPLGPSGGTEKDPHLVSRKARQRPFPVLFEQFIDVAKASLNGGRVGERLDHGAVNINYGFRTTTMSTFAERLRTVREAAGFSQYALAKRSGLTKQVLSRLELGENEPSWATVQLLAAALGVDCRAFVDPGLRLPDEEPALPSSPLKKSVLAGIQYQCEVPTAPS